MTRGVGILSRADEDHELKVAIGKERWKAGMSSGGNWGKGGRIKEPGIAGEIREIED